MNAQQIHLRPGFDPGADHFTKTNITTSDLTTSTGCYLETYFKGSVRFFSTNRVNCHVFISLEGFAYFLKSILKATGDSFPILSFESLEDAFVVAVQFPEIEKLLPGAISIMKSSGFEFTELYQGTAYFSTPARTSRALSIYCPGQEIFIKVLENLRFRL